MLLTITGCVCSTFVVYCTCKSLSPRISPLTCTSKQKLLHTQFTLADSNSRRIQRIHIPKSDVFYVREAIYNDTGVWYTLDHVERAMYLEGHLDRKEVLDPDRKREYGDN